jgi:hypothetical protein
MIGPSGETLIISHFIMWLFSLERVESGKFYDCILDKEIPMHAQIGEHCCGWSNIKYYDSYINHTQS